MKRTSTTKSLVKINFRGVVLAQDFENKLLNINNKTNLLNHQLLIDFRNANYIEISALMNIISLLKNNSLDIFIGYPENKNVRDFLNIWRFREAVEFVINDDLKRILVEEDYHYLNEKQTTYTGIGDGIEKLEYNPDAEMYSDVQRNFFEFLSFRLSQINENTEDFISNFDIARNEADRWSNSLITSVLRKHLTPDTKSCSVTYEESVIENNDVARVVILEAFNNSVFHPNATMIQTVSKFNRSIDNSIGKHDLNKIKKLQGTLRICIWDDGDSIPSTLLKPLKENKEIKVHTNLESTQYMNYYVDYRKLEFQDGKIIEKKKGPFIINENDTLKKSQQEKEARALLYSLFPGITRTATFTDEQLEKTGGQEYKHKRVRGMGLYNLKSAVIDQNYGTILIRSSNYRLNIRPSNLALSKMYKVRYIAKITQYPDEYQSFHGNLIVIQLPIS